MIPKSLQRMLELSIFAATVEKLGNVSPHNFREPMMKLGIPRETEGGEQRVFLPPELIPRVQALGLTVLVETGAGHSAGWSDESYAEQGATVLSDADQLWSTADMVVTLGGVPLSRWQQLQPGAVLAGMLNPLANAEALAQIAMGDRTVLALERLPRTSRAQALDVLSSQATVAGYRAVLLAAQALSGFMPMLTTAAGTLPPAKVLVIGAGVAGLQAIATAKRLGGIVTAFDVRPQVKEEIESLGARFLSVDLTLAEDLADQNGYAKSLGTPSLEQIRTSLEAVLLETDAVICTAQVPNQLAPKLIPAGLLERMRPGAVIVDAAAPSGGNCERTVPGHDQRIGSVRLLSPLNLAAEVPRAASAMLGRNLLSLLQLVIQEGELCLDLDDSIMGAIALIQNGILRDPALLERLQPV
jgi:NAD(P) transhydrogenase subunit alpha